MLDYVRRAAEIRLSRPARAHRPGALLQHLKADLAGFDFELIAADRARIRAPGVEFEACEIVEPQFLMHIVSTEFSCEIRAAEPVGTLLISARHLGAWRRTGVELVSTGSPQHSVIERLTRCATLQGALKGLDFTDWRLQCREHDWRLTVRHFGASEVVGHMPAFRRYVRLEKAQCDALVSSMRAVKALLT
jgi:hypothetical protein